MALSIEEREALLELKNKGYSYSDAMGFIGSSRMGNTSKVERDYSRSATPEPVRDDTAMADLSGGFDDAKQAVQAGLDRDRNIEQQDRSKPSELFGKFTSGTRAAGAAIGSIGSGVIRALPFGTAAMDKVEDVVGRGVERVASSKEGQSIASGYRSLPQGARNFLGDVGNLGMGAAELAGPIAAPGAGSAVAKGFRTFAEAGVKDMGQVGIRESVNIGLSPDDLMQRVARISKGKQAKFEQRANESVGSYLVNRGIFGDPEAITDQLYQRMQASKDRVDVGLSQVGGTYKNDSVQDALEQLLEREARVSTARTPSPDQAEVFRLLKKHEADGLSLSEVNQVKRLYERNVKLDYLRDNVSDGIARANNIDNKLREFVVEKADEGGFSTVKDLNRETFLAKQLLDDLGAEYAGQAGNNFVSLSDAIFLAEAASNPSALAAFGLKKTLSSASAMSGVAKILAKKREKQGLPSGEVTGSLGLPAGTPGQVPTTFGSKQIDLPADSNRLGGTIEAQSRNINQPSGDRTPTALEGELKRDQMAIDQALLEMDVEISERPDISGGNMAINSEGSYYRFKSLPTWIPKELRDGAVLDKVMQNIRDGKQPRGNATSEQALQKVVEGHIADRVKELKDTDSPSGVFSNDTAFAAALMIGGTYYLSTQDGDLLPVIAVAGMASPQGRRMIAKSVKVQNLPDSAKREIAQALEAYDVSPMTVRERSGMSSDGRLDTINLDGDDADFRLSQLQQRNAEGKITDKEWVEARALLEDRGAIESFKKGATPQTTLLEEAKGKTLDEFVKAQGVPVFRGELTNPDPRRLKEGDTPGYEGVAYSRNREIADNYGDNITESFLPEDKILKSDDINPELLQMLRDELDEVDIYDADSMPTERIIAKAVWLAKQANKGGADIAEIFPKLDYEAEIRLVDRSQVKTKSQLEDIWKQANK